MKLTIRDHEILKAAIAKAERGTSGEILCVVTPEAHAYNGVPVLAGLGAAVVVPLVMMGLVASGAAPFAVLSLPAAWGVEPLVRLMENVLLQTLLLQVAAFVVVAGVCDVMAVKHRLVPRALQRARAHEKAVAQFVAQGITRTKARTGIMLFVALAEHHAEVIADEGIFAKVEQRVWDEMIAALIGRIKAGELRAGLEAAIASAGVILAEGFPASVGDVNEIGDGVVEV